MKRFVETNRWRDVWFRRLSPTAKLLWNYLTDNCDCVGLIDLDIESAAFHIGAAVNEKHLTELADRIQRTVDGKIFIPRFIPFQYGALSEKCPAHKPVLRLIALRELTLNGIGYQYPNDRVSKGMPMSLGKGKGWEGKEGSGEEGEGAEAPSLPLEIPVVKAEEIYAAYPLKKERPVALVAIKEAMKRHAPEMILERTKAYAEARGGNIDFVPYPAKWFKREGFLDDPATWRPSVPAERTNEPRRQMSAFEINQRITAINQEIDRFYRADKVTNREQIDLLKAAKQTLKDALAQA